MNVLGPLRDEVLRFTRHFQDLSRSAIDLPRDEEGNELLRDFPKINVAAHEEVFMAPIGITERICIVLENVDFSGQTFFPQSLFSRRQAGFKQSLTGFIVNDEVENIIALGGGILRMAASVLIEPSAVHQERVGRPAVWNETFKNIPQHLLHRQIDTSVRRKNEAVLILQTKDPSSQGIGFQHANTTRIPAGSAFFNSRTRSADAVCLVRLVCFVYLVDLVYLVSFVQPNKRDRPNKPNNSLLTLAGFFSILLGG